MFEVLPYVIEITNGNHIFICKSSIDIVSYYCYEWFLFTSFMVVNSKCKVRDYNFGGLVVIMKRFFSKHDYGKENNEMNF